VRRSLSIAYLAFIGLGLHDGLLGVAWPSMRDTFGVSTDSVGLILLAITLGFGLSSAASGWFVGRIGVGKLLLLGAGLRTVGLLAVALAPVWWGMMAAALLTGLGGGGLDAGLNTYVATNHRASHMNWLHACYGVGTTVAPLIVTALLVAGRAWQWGYVVVGAFQAAMAIVLFVTLGNWRLRSPSDESGEEPVVARGADTFRLPLVWLSVTVFVFITGTEIATGQWVYTLFTESRAIVVSTAGLWVSIYWGSFTLGRILVGFAADRVRPVFLLRAAMIGNVAGAALLWWNPVNGVGFAGLALMGFALAPLYPFLMSLTPGRLGAGHAANAIGLQGTGGALGGATLPALAGVLAVSVGLEIIGPFLLVASVVLLALHEAVVAFSR
jgi:fucose permease